MDKNLKTLSILVGLLVAVSSGTYGVVRYVEVDRLQAKLDDCQHDLASALEKPRLGTDSAQSQSRPAKPQVKGRAAERQVGQLTKERDKLVNNLNALQNELEGLQAELDECRSMPGRVTRGNFWLHMNTRNATTYKGVEYGFTLVKWVSKDTTDVMISVDTQGQPPKIVEVRGSRPAAFVFNGLRLRMELPHAQRINDRVKIVVTETE